jgi:hypothetical protein
LVESSFFSSAGTGLMQVSTCHTSAKRFLRRIEQLMASSLHYSVRIATAAKPQSRHPGDQAEMSSNNLPGENIGAIQFVPGRPGQRANLPPSWRHTKTRIAALQAVANQESRL